LPGRGFATVARVPELISPNLRLRDSWLASRDEWGDGVLQDGSGLSGDDDVDSREGFAAWIARLRRAADTSVPAGQGRVHATCWWIAEDDEYLGAITLRHALNAFLRQAGGNVGYGIRPSARGRGLAAWALRSILPEARDLGLAEILITCDDSNLASARTIENSGGVLEDIRDTELGRTRRYWITL
jgi:predicted acetyltransferase